MKFFKEISFGYTSAESEAASEPALLLEGFLDYKNGTHEAINGTKFLYLGYKGSGKSAIGQHIYLKSKDDPMLFSRVIHLEDFPFTNFGKIIRGDGEPEAKYPAAWSWLLLIYALQSLCEDNGLSHPDKAELHTAQRAFAAMGLTPNDNIASLVKKSAKASFQLKIPGDFGGYTRESGESRPASDIPNFIDSLRSLLSKSRSRSKHILVIDGLDDILTSREVQYKSISALIFETSRLNAHFHANDVPMKIVILCRTDLFDRIPGPNKNKVRQDSSVELDWYHDVQEPQNSLLIKLAERRGQRAGLSAGWLSEMFNFTVDGTPALKAFLDMTRHTPRDFLRLFHYMQQFATNEWITVPEIKSGMRDYSIKYFLPEIRDELSGFVDPAEIDLLVRTLGRIRQRDFSFADLSKSIKETTDKFDDARLEETLRVLFERSAIGNIQNRRTGTTFYTFNFRNRHSSFNKNENILLHKGLWKALNLT